MMFKVGDIIESTVDLTSLKIILSISADSAFVRSTNGRVHYIPRYKFSLFHVLAASALDALGLAIGGYTNSIFKDALKESIKEGHKDV